MKPETAYYLKRLRESLEMERAVWKQMQRGSFAVWLWFHRYTDHV